MLVTNYFDSFVLYIYCIPIYHHFYFIWYGKTFNIISWYNKTNCIGGFKTIVLEIAVAELMIFLNIRKTLDGIYFEVKVDFETSLMGWKVFHSDLVKYWIFNS